MPLWDLLGHSCLHPHDHSAGLHGPLHGQSAPAPEFLGSAPHASAFALRKEPDLDPFEPQCEVEPCGKECPTCPPPPPPLPWRYTTLVCEPPGELPKSLFYKLDAALLGGLLLRLATNHENK